MREISFEDARRILNKDVDAIVDLPMDAHEVAGLWNTLHKSEAEVVEGGVLIRDHSHLKHFLLAFWRAMVNEPRLEAMIPVAWEFHWKSPAVLTTGGILVEDNEELEVALDALDECE